MRLFMLCVLLLSSAQVLSSTNWQTYGVILSGQQASALLRQCSRAAPQQVSAQWIPSKKLIEQLESKLGAFKRMLKRPGRQLSGFYRQYAGFVAAGRKIIYVNFFPKNTDPAWRSRAVGVCDGGEVFWGVEFEVETGKFVNAAFNGPA